MKKSYKMIVMAMVIIGMITMGTAFAKNKGTVVGNTSGETDSRPMPPPRHGGHLLERYIHDNMAAETLSELTGKELATVKTDMQDKHLGELLETYAIDMTAFKTAMDAKTITTAQKVFNCGLITQEQLTAITEEIQTDSSDDTENCESVINPVPAGHRPTGFLKPRRSFFKNNKKLTPCATLNTKDTKKAQRTQHFVNLVKSLCPLF